MDLCTTACNGLTAWADQKAGGNRIHMCSKDFKFWKAREHAGQFQVSLSSQVSGVRQACQPCQDDCIFAMDCDLGYADSHFPPPKHDMQSLPFNKWQRMPQPSSASTSLPTQKPSKLQQQLARALAWNRDSSELSADANAVEQSQQPAARKAVAYCKDSAARSLACDGLPSHAYSRNFQLEQRSTHTDNTGNQSHDHVQHSPLDSSSAVHDSSARRLSTAAPLVQHESSALTIPSKPASDQDPVADTLASPSQHTIPPQLSVFHLPSPSPSLPAYDHDDTPGACSVQHAQPSTTRSMPEPSPASAPPSDGVPLPAPEHANDASSSRSRLALTRVSPAASATTHQATGAAQHPPPGSTTHAQPQHRPSIEPQPLPNPPLPSHHGSIAAGLTAASPITEVTAMESCGCGPSGAGV